jgi:hypothetical protein
MKQESEGKADRFKRLAERRVGRAIKDLRSIGNLANRANYSYSDEQVRKIIRALRLEVSALGARFADGSGSGDGQFRL